MSEKGVIFVQNSIINCVTHIRHKIKMSTSLHAVFIVNSGNVYFNIVIFNIHGRKMRFSESSQISISENSIFGQFEVFFSTYKFFPGWECLFPVSTFQEKYFNEKMSSVVGLRKRYLIFRGSTDFGHIWLTRSTFKVDFHNVQAKFQKILAHFPGEGC